MDSPLTVREQEIAVLAAAGMTNTRIAARVHLTVSTVEQRLTSTYRKLGCHREGLAAALDPKDPAAMSIHVHEIRANPDTGEIALYVPSGHPVDPCPWLVIQPGRPSSYDDKDMVIAFGEATSHDWTDDREIRRWPVLDLGDYLPTVKRLGDLEDPR